MEKKTIPYSATVTKISSLAMQFSQRFGSKMIRPEDMLFALLASDSLMLDGFWKQKKMLPRELMDGMSGHMTASQENVEGDMGISQETQMLANAATDLAVDMGCVEVDEGHLLAACCQPKSNWISPYLRDQKGINNHEVELYVSQWHHGLGGQGGAQNAISMDERKALMNAAEVLGRLGAKHGPAELARQLYGFCHNVDGQAVQAMQASLGTSDELRYADQDAVKQMYANVNGTEGLMNTLRHDCKERIALEP